MLVRLFITGALALGLIAAPAASAEADVFKGKTGQGYRIKIIVKGNSFRIHTFDIDLKCRDGSAVILEEGGFLWTKPKKNGRFRDAQFGKTDSVYFRGKATNKRIRGKVRVTDKEKRGPKCGSRWITFNATPR